MMPQFCPTIFTAMALCTTFIMAPAKVLTEETLPIADAHVHYSHDSVELTPPQRVIELMKAANLKFALVSSSDDNGTQLLSDLAPELIVPGLRPYRRRGETGTWFTDPQALAYVERLLATNRYATIGEFHLYGDSADLEIPRRIVELADQHNLILHAHSDAEAVERLLAQSSTVKVIWAHSGFDSPEDIAPMLAKHDRLWADLAFRSEVGSGGTLSEDWLKLFTDFPDRLMLGTDTYTPERMYFIPENAVAARTWLATLPAGLAENIAWKNAYNLIMPVWKKNRIKKPSPQDDAAINRQSLCDSPVDANTYSIKKDNLSVRLSPPADITVSNPFSASLTLCGENIADANVSLDASMPLHGHGMNYQPTHKTITSNASSKTIEVSGLVLHMPGEWQWSIDIRTSNYKETLVQNFVVN